MDVGPQNGQKMEKTQRETEVDGKTGETMTLIDFLDFREKENGHFVTCVCASV